MIARGFVETGGAPISTYDTVASLSERQLRVGFRLPTFDPMQYNVEDGAGICTSPIKVSCVYK